MAAIADVRAARASSLALLRETYGSASCVNRLEADTDDDDSWPVSTTAEDSGVDEPWESGEDDCLESEWDAVTVRTDLLRLEHQANFGKIQPTADASTGLISYREIQAWLSQMSDSAAVLQPLENRSSTENAAPTLLQKRLNRRGGKNLVQNLKNSPFDFNTPMHFRMLRTIYTKLTLNKWCPSVGNHWEVVGFQGGDPRTDLNRCGGVLNVLHLFYFITHHLDLATTCFQLSQDEHQNFPLACISVNITSLVVDGLSAGRFTALCNKEATDLGVLEVTCRLHSAALAFFLLTLEKPEANDPAH